MGSVTPLGERLRFVPPRLGADIDVLTVARTIAENCAVESPGQIHARIARSGLLALSVPTELGGADITNDVLSQALAIISAADAGRRMISLNISPPWNSSGTRVAKTSARRSSPVLILARPSRWQYLPLIWIRRLW